MRTYSIITGTGSYIPEKIVPNSNFMNHQFYDSNGILLPQSNEEIIRKFQEITGINTRRYVDDNLVASDIGFFAAQKALKDSGLNPENLDYIIVAHNFGDVKINNRRSDFVPSLAARIKNKLGIKNPKCVAHDLPFGCPGWLQGVIQADYLIHSGEVQHVLVIGNETLSRISDPHDRDSMIYADGAGAVIVKAAYFDRPIGILSHAVRSDTIDHSKLLWMGSSYNPNYPGNDLFLKMNGNALYKYALRYVPEVVKESLDKAGLHLSDVSKLLIHQANAKMDYAILQEVCKLYGIKNIPYDIMPMTIHELGNSSVATIPTLLDLLVHNKLPEHKVKSGDNIIKVSLGAGMNINAMVYRMP
ncbi:MAG: 3-oxoacyl-[acyl-carrier-protein] synthase III C-terminal domain-containing protein [Candidatus Absconditabacterales bacterium]|jgi:3-oxoacyl-[acyl-carrier-protein] synthase-3